MAGVTAAALGSRLLRGEPLEHAVQAVGRGVEHARSASQIKLASLAIAHLLDRGAIAEDDLGDAGEVGAEIRPATAAAGTRRDSPGRCPAAVPPTNDTERTIPVSPWGRSSLGQERSCGRRASSAASRSVRRRPRPIRREPEAFERSARRQDQTHGIEHRLRRAGRTPERPRVL
jgi:hypothetical protein